MKFNLPVNYTKLHWSERRLVREQYVVEQNGLCMYCNHPLKDPAPEHIQEKRINWRMFPQDFLKYPVHLQHCHTTGMTEGAVHNYCNAVMFQYEGR